MSNTGTAIDILKLSLEPDVKSSLADELVKLAIRLLEEEQSNDKDSF